MITGTLLAFFHPQAPAKASHPAAAGLTLAERVAYQRAIEEVYWRHRIWPKANAGPKPSLNKVMPQAEFEKKVEDYLRNSQALEDYWQRAITPEQLQAEMERIASHTKQPEVLRELFEALGNDPFVIAECLARPILSERMVTTLDRGDQRLGSLQTKAETQATREVAAIDSIAKAVQVNRPYRLPVIASPSGGCTDDTWTTTSVTNAPAARRWHTAVWTGSEMIVWGGISSSGSNVNTGGRYTPSTDTWTATSTTNAPAARNRHTAVWTGSEMIVWGGYVPGAGDSNTGGKYNLGTDTWTATNTANAPDAREVHRAVWTGSEMIVWGGSGNSARLNTGGRYDPSADSWTATSLTNAPAARYGHTAVWSGSEMIVWGGHGDSGYLNTGGRYNPSTDSWTATSIVGTPDGRQNQTAVWTGSEMIVWGGDDFSNYFNTGGTYDPSTDSLTATNIIGVPAARVAHTAVWIGSEMIVWGGYDGNAWLNTGSRYNPSTDSWTATSLTNAPQGRGVHTAVLTGNEMIVWGGSGSSGYLNTGGRYCAQSGPTPTPTPTATSIPCHVTSSACGSVITGAPPTDFIVNVSDPVDPATLQPTDFTVNGTPADSYDTINFIIIVFHFNTSPVVQGLNTMQISAGVFNCFNGPVQEFNCTFTYQLSTPTPTPTPTPTASPTSTPSPRPTPVTRPRPIPHPRP